MRQVISNIVAAALCCSSAAAEQGEAKEERLVLPSGLEASLQEMLWDRPGGGLVYRFRFVAPKFTDAMPFDVLMADLEFLCTTYALERLADIGPQPGRIIVSLADKPSKFGEFDPGVTQVFEAYKVEDGVCIWEMF